MATVREYRMNLKAGKAKATVVHDLLNKLKDDDSGKMLGDMFNSETLQDKVGVTKSITADNKDKLPDLLTILMQGNISYKHGFVIGGFKRMKYEDYKINMKPGSKHFVYTDGVTEATDANNQLFGIERTVLSLNKSKNASLQTLLETVDADVREFVGDAEQFDDLTMMCIEYYGNSAVKDSH